MWPKQLKRRRCLISLWLCPEIGQTARTIAEALFLDSERIEHVEIEVHLTIPAKRRRVNRGGPSARLTKVSSDNRIGPIPGEPEHSAWSATSK